MRFSDFLPFWGKAGSGTLALVAPRPQAQFAIDIPSVVAEQFTAGGAIAQRVSRAEALQVPAVQRVRNLIAGTLATLPVHVRHIESRETQMRTPLLRQIDPDVPNVVTLAETYEDLLFEGISWWHISDFTAEGFPARARHVPVQSVHVGGASLLPSELQVTADHPIPADGQVFIDGREVPDSEVIRFDSPNPPLLRHAARAIRTALRLEAAAQRFADAPTPGGFITSADGVDPDPDEIQRFMDDLHEKIGQRRYVYLTAGAKPVPTQWSAEQIQLDEQRKESVLEIARAAGVDPEDLGVSTTSRTYQNAEQRRLDFLDFTLRPYLAAVEQRLSMNDVLPPGFAAKVNLDAFLRSDTKTRMETYDIGRTVGAYTVEEVRELEDRPALTAEERAEVMPQQAQQGQAASPMGEVQKEALNGAQMASLLTVLQQVSTKQLSPVTAKEMLKVAFPTLSPGQIDRLVDSADRFVPPTPEVESPDRARSNGRRAEVVSNGR